MKKFADKKRGDALLLHSFNFKVGIILLRNGNARPKLPKKQIPFKRLKTAHLPFSFMIEATSPIVIFCFSLQHPCNHVLYILEFTLNFR